MNAYKLMGLIILGTLALPALSDEEIQKDLDEKCEAARQVIIQPLKEEDIRKCIEDRRRDPGYCERYYRNYGDASANRPALFYGIPECVEAFDHRKGR